MVRRAHPGAISFSGEGNGERSRNQADVIFVTYLSGLGEALRRRPLLIRFSQPCGRFGFLGSWIVTEDTDEWRLKLVWFCSTGFAFVVCGAGVVSEKTDASEDLNSDESMLSSVLWLVVEPSNSFGK
jgi:hypothetical protein